MDLKTLVKKADEHRHGLHLLIVWSILIAASAVWNIHENYSGTSSKALIEAKTIFQHNLAYRRWNAMNDGVYVKVSERTPPNPYILDETRDLTTKEGVKLTIINPFQMTRQAYDLLRIQSPELAVLNRTVSLNPINQDNEPDEWERKALLLFEKGKGEMSDITTINGAPFMRLIAPYVTEERCLKCHEYQGYHIGDIRGGMSVAVPMQPYWDAAGSARKIIVMTHLLLWLLGTLAITLFFASFKKYKIALRQNEEKFRIVSEFAYNFEYWINEKREISFISPSCDRITGYSREDFLNSSQLMYDLVHPDDKVLFKKHLADFGDPPHEDIEFRIITKDGDVRWMAHTCTPIYVDGKFLGRRGSNRDITTNKKLKEELQQAKKVEEIGRFAGGIAHDFNNVLTSVSSLTSLLKGQINHDKPQLQKIVNYILIATKLGQNLTSNLLMFGRKRTTNLEKLKLNGTITKLENVIGSLLSDLIACSITLDDSESYVMIDQHQVEQILINLSINARDAMPAGGSLGICTSRKTIGKTYLCRYGDIPRGDYMVLSISDTGHGIAEEILDKIFHPFFSTKPDNKGTGLGLSIIHDIVLQHKGYIDVKSVLKEGTVFSVYFPVVQS
ncbi:MAG: ATP-binding protein [Pseudomonadota bacterium]